jgi:hypothetical protein
LAVFFDVLQIRSPNKTENFLDSYCHLNCPVPTQDDANAKTVPVDLVHCVNDKTVTLQRFEGWSLLPSAG